METKMWFMKIYGKQEGLKRYLLRRKKAKEMIKHLEELGVTGCEWSSCSQENLITR